MNCKKTEVLAPVGNFESLTAAIRSGADAVYFGCKDFSARRNAVNFSFKEMETAIKYCKRNKVKAYLTLNIAIKDSEAQSALETAKQAYLLGVDGLIVSDIGIASLINKALPEVELHASTQMSVNSPSALKLLKEIGFCRVVPAREMSKKELISFCAEAKKLNMEVEVFVHGALCMCLSGQCLLSSALGGRSGNRGLCAGPCRLPFSVGNGTGYDLSLKDLSLFDYVGELIEMGVTSFKIEGRMKRPEYVSATVSACRSAVDNGKVPDNLNEVLKGVFSRSGFTDGYYKGRLGREMFGTRSKDDVEKSKETYAFLHNLYRNELQKIPLSISAKIVSNENIFLVAKTEEFEVSVIGEIPQTAKNRPITKEDINAQLSKFGGTQFFAKDIKTTLDDGLFVSHKTLNELRRQLCEKLTEKYEKIKSREIFSADIKTEDKEHRTIPKIYAYFLDISKIPEDLTNVDLCIIPLEKSGEITYKQTEMAVDIPKFTSDEERIKQMLKISKEKGIKKAVCHTLSAVCLAKDSGFEIIGGMGLNVLNEYSAKILNELSLNEIILSPEILLNRANSFKTKLDKGIFAYGRLPLMSFRNCPVKNGKTCSDCDKNGEIIDRTNTHFPIRCRVGFSEMFNSKPVFLADRLSEMKNLDFYLLFFTTEQSTEIVEIIDKYKTGAKAPNDFTRGMYFKDVL